MAEPRQVATAAQLAARVNAIPSLPKALAHVQRAVSARFSSASSVANAIEKDPPLAARVLRLANSGFYARGERVGTVRNAVARLGMREVQSLVTTAGLLGVFGADDAALMRDLYLHSLLCATVSGKIMRAAPRSLGGVDPAEYFTAGLLHDVGLFVVHKFAPKALLECIEYARANKEPLSAVEQIAMGYSHAEVGALLLQRWRLSDLDVHACRWHHTAADAPLSVRPVASMYHLADVLSCEVLGGDILPVVVGPLDSIAHAALDLDETAWQRLRVEATESATDARELMTALLG